MKKLSPIFAFTFLTIQLQLLGQLSQPAMDSSFKGSSEIKGFEKFEKPKSPEAPTVVLPPPVTPMQQVPQKAEYLHPGILVNLGGRWEGSDHLLNLPSNIGIYLKIIKPEEAKLEINELELKRQVQAIFENANIKPITLAPPGKAPLPAFEIEIFIYPIEKGYAAFLDGRLFESVVLDRFKMDPNMEFQAITWEKQNLIVSPKDKFGEQLSKATQEIANAFVERYIAYERLKQRSSHSY